jgi:hypothetical protein
MSDNENYEVGYKKPPKHGQFQKGNSGNPGGRRRPVVANANSALASVLAKRVTVSDGEGEARMSLLEAFMQDLVRKARDGNTRCMKLVLDQLHDLEADTSAKTELEGLCQKAAREDTKEQRTNGEGEQPDPGAEN